MIGHQLTGAIMPNVHLTAQMQEFAKPPGGAGLYANLSQVVREGMRRLMEERGGRRSTR